jgi:transcriptional regulator with XRE-family HTH domain/signal peptidase I
MENFGDRFLTLRKKKELNQDELAVLLNVSRATISDYERGRSEPNFETLRKISEFFEVSIDMLLGNAHPNDNADDQQNHVKSTPKSAPNSTPNRVNEPNITAWGRVPKIVTVDSSGNDNVVLVPIRARAGYLAGFEDPEFIQTLPTYRLPGLTAGTFRMFEVFGHSMVPTFHESDIIITRYVENLLEIRDDRVYVVVSKRDGVVVKRVVNRVQRDSVLILNSDNQRHAGEYPPIVVNPEEVLEIWYAYAYMSRQMRAPGEMYNRLIDVESRLTLIEADRRKALPK